MSAAIGQAAVWREVARVVFPEVDLEALPLYLDTSNDLEAVAAVGAEEEARWTRGMAMPGTAVSTSFGSGHHDYVRSRRSVTVPAGERVSFATYFNAFPASYWRRWTVVTGVRLDVEFRGDATVLVYRSNARGIRQMVELSRGRQVDGADPAAGERAGGRAAELTTRVSFDLPIAPFGDGGWYWFDLAAGHHGADLVSASWSVSVPPDRAAKEPGTLSLGITTMNREQYCVDTLRTLAADPDVRKLIDCIYVIDQGGDTLRHTDGFEQVATDLGDQLRVIVQDNLGGSGGFSRGMVETLDAGTSRYLLILDDDVNVETEGIRRSVAFAELTRRPTLVGGHMFNMYDRPTMHAFGERVRDDFTWGPIDRRPPVNFALSNLRSRPWMHRRMDVNYNGWWMCLIPTAVIAEIGLSIPAFLKWDDAEFCLRAGDHGYPTVSMPGVAVWHVPWTDKDDSVDWQAYLHQHNRLVTALLHGPKDKPARIVLDSMAIDLMHTSAMQYYATTLRLQALEDILSGPSHLHDRLRTVLPWTRGQRADFDDARIETDPDAFPPARGLGRTPLPMVGKRPGPKKLGPWLASTAWRQAMRKPKDSAALAPQAYIAKMDANWWRLAQVDSAVVSNADGSGASWHRRDRATFRALMRRSVTLHRQLSREWPQLSAQYRRAMPEFTSAQTWKATFEGPASDQESSTP